MISGIVSGKLGNIISGYTDNNSGRYMVTSEIIKDDDMRIPAVMEEETFNHIKGFDIDLEKDYIIGGDLKSYNTEDKLYIRCRSIKENTLKRNINDFSFSGIVRHFYASEVDYKIYSIVYNKVILNPYRTKSYYFLLKTSYMDEMAVGTRVEGRGKLIRYGDKIEIETISICDFSKEYEKVSITSL